MRSYTIVGNWKMFLGPAEAEKFMANLNKLVTQHTHVTSVICPPFVSLPAVVKAAEADTLKVGAQNINANDEGAYTGEISGPMIKQLAQFVIVGHSERRKYYGETDKDVAAKLVAALRNDLTPIVCIGENLQERHEGHHKQVVVDQLHDALRDVAADDLANIMIAYEPVWAIGTGEFAKPEQVAEIIETIRRTIEELFSEGSSSQVKLLYGGSVDPDNCKAYLKLEHVAGLLVGGASVNYQKFANIIEAAADLTE